MHGGGDMKNNRNKNWLALINFLLIFFSNSIVISCSQAASVQSALESSTEEKSVSLKTLCKDYFKFGCGLTGNSESTNAINLSEYMALVEDHFSSCTMTNLMKPANVLSQSKSIAAYTDETSEPVLDFSKIQSTLEWCMNNNVQMRGHTLVWHKQAPEWFFHEGYTSDGAIVSAEVMKTRLDSFIKQYMNYVQDNFPGVVYCWDVVNEAVAAESRDGVSLANADTDTNFMCRKLKEDGSENLWYSTLGSDYPEIAFTIARKYAAEGVSLIYNDYNAVYSTKRQYIYNLCSSLKEKGLIDGIGMQAYWSVEESTPTEDTIKNAINLYSELDLELQVTEWSMEADTDEDGECSEEELSAQAERYASILRLLKSLDTQSGGSANITCVSFFGLVDNYPLYQNNTDTARLFYSNYEPKPVFYSIQNVLKED